jgi:glycosyltransferase involved in cell wall biosynthesis
MTMADAPILSIVIPTYNRPAQLAVCLQACARLDYPPDCFEVIVVDDGGTVPLDEVVARFHDVLTLRLLRQDNAGPAAARNTGASEARGEFLAFTDDDCSPAPTWLQALAAQFAMSPECAVGGRTLNALTNNRYSATSQHLISYLLSYYNVVPHAARFFPSNNLAVPAREFRAMGGFDTTYPRAAAEDRELCDRWLHMGYRMIYAAEAVVYHAHGLTFGTFLGQHFRYGRGAFCFHRVRARRGQHHFKVEPAAFYIDMLRYPFVNTKGIDALVVMLLLIVTQVANAAGMFWESARVRLM